MYQANAAKEAALLGVIATASSQKQVPEHEAEQQCEQHSKRHEGLTMESSEPAANHADADEAMVDEEQQLNVGRAVEIFFWGSIKGGDASCRDRSETWPTVRRIFTGRRGEAA